MTVSLILFVCFFSLILRFYWSVCFTLIDVSLVFLLFLCVSAFSFYMFISFVWMSIFFASSPLSRFPYLSLPLPNFLSFSLSSPLLYHSRYPYLPPSLSSFPFPSYFPPLNLSSTAQRKQLHVLTNQSEGHYHLADLERGLKEYRPYVET